MQSGILHLGADKRSQFIGVDDVADIPALVAKALHYKQQPLVDVELGKHKKIGLLFFNPSLRTRISTQVAAANLGMEAIVFNVDNDGWALEFEEGILMNGSTVEHIKDAAPVLGNYFDILCIRSFPELLSREDDYSEKLLRQFILHTGKPILSLESSTLHPLQSLTDIITIKEQLDAVPLRKPRPKVVLTWAPHIKPLPQCVANSFAQWVTAWGQADIVIAHPAGYELADAYTAGAEITHDQDAALIDADFVYVKNWSAYHDYGAMPGAKGHWMLTNDKLAVTNNAKVMHCLPVRRNLELSDEVLDGAHSIVTTQAANRVWAAQAVLSELMR